MNAHPRIAHACQLIKDGEIAALRDLADSYPEIKASQAIVFECIYRRRELLRDVLEMGFVPEEKERADPDPSYFGYTPLMHACGQGLAHEIKLLLKFGANMFAKNEDGETPFGYAICWEQMKAVRCLVEHGADPRKIYDAASYLQFAEGFRNKRMYKFLKSVAQSLDFKESRAK